MSGKAVERKLTLPGLVNAKAKAKKIHEMARRSKRGGGSQQREPYPGDMVFGNPQRLFADSEYDLYAPPEACKQKAEWKKHLVGGRSFIPPNRENCAAAVCGNELYMFGGLGGGPEGRYNLLCALNFNTMNWRVERPLEGAPPPPCCKHSMVSYDRSLYLYGGEGEFEGEYCRGDLRSTRHIHNKMYKYDTRAATWHALPTVGEPPERRIPFARRNHSSVIVEDFHSGASVLIYAGSGLEPIKARDRLLNDMWAFNVKKESWTYVNHTGQIPTPRAGHSATLIKSAMYVYGGVVESASGGSGTSTELHCFDTQNLVWSEIHYTGSGPGGVFNHAAVYHPWSHNEGKILVFGGRRSGSSESPTSTVYCFDAAKSAWHEVVTNGRTPAGKFSMVTWAVRKCVVSFGGCDSKGYCNSDLHILSLPDPPFDNQNEDMMTKLSKMDSREMLSRSSMGGNVEQNSKTAPVDSGGSKITGAIGGGGSVLSSIMPMPSGGLGGSSIMPGAGLSMLPEDFGPVPSLEELRSFLPSMSYKAFKGIVGQGRSSVDCMLPNGELKPPTLSAPPTNSMHGGESRRPTVSGLAAGGSTLNNFGEHGVVESSGVGMRSTTAPAGVSSVSRGMGSKSVSAPTIVPVRPGTVPPQASFLDAGSAVPLELLELLDTKLRGDGAARAATASSGGAATLGAGSTLGPSGSVADLQHGSDQPLRNSMSLKDIMTLGNGSFFVDPVGEEEERSVLSDKTWVRQHLHRSYVPPRKLRSQGHIYLRGRDTRRKMALGQRDVAAMLPEGTALRTRPMTSMSLRPTTTVTRVPKLRPHGL
jgi:N-acetylneuraminic acid mutarotase